MNLANYHEFSDRHEEPTPDTQGSEARWAAVQRAADALAMMLGQRRGAARGDGFAWSFSPRPPGNFPPTAEAALADLAAMMETGLFAILKAREGGAEAQIAARVLLARYEGARARLLACMQSESTLQNHPAADRGLPSS